MESRLNFRTLIASGFCAAASMVLGSGPGFAEEKLKVGFVYPSPIGDNGWSYRHEVGRQDIIAHFGDQIETTFVESVPEGPDATRVITQLALTGHELILQLHLVLWSRRCKLPKSFRMSISKTIPASKQHPMSVCTMRASMKVGLSLEQSPG